MFYGQEYNYHNLQKLTKAIMEYIRYYNEERISGSSLKEMILTFCPNF
ncbi:IS3 family transposase [Lactobacillus kullabergensis]